MEWSQHRYQDEPCSGEHAHKLLEWLKWLTKIELDIHMLNSKEICGEGGEMVGVVPLPRRSLVFVRILLEMDDANRAHSLVVVMEDPSKTFDVMCCDPGMNFSAPLIHVELGKRTFS